MKRVPLFKFTTLLILVMLLLQGCAASTLPSNYFQPADWQALTVSARGVAWGIQQASLGLVDDILGQHVVVEP